MDISLHQVLSKKNSCISAQKFKTANNYCGVSRIFSRFFHSIAVTQYCTFRHKKLIIKFIILSPSFAPRTHPFQRFFLPQHRHHLR